MFGILAYFGPETTLPLVSVLGAVIGVLMMGWGFVTGFVKKCWRLVFKKGAEPAATAATADPPVGAAQALDAPVDPVNQV
jgi:hypothetical protein